jgi:RNA polymerase sigma-70 factor, ECF subfamily
VNVYRTVMALRPAALSLLDAAKDGDDGAFETLLAPLLEPGYRLAGGMLQDHQAAQDAVQEAALKAWSKLRQLRDKSQMRPWFLAIVANECRSARRSRWSSVLKLVLLDKGSDVPTDSVVSGVDVRRALRGLDEKKRLAIVLRFYLDLPVHEIAEITRSEVDAVESQLRRAVSELRHLMEDHRG